MKLWKALSAVRAPFGLPLLLLLLLCVSAGSAVAQDERPTDWVVTFDDPAAEDSSLFFVAMEPGWHITSAPAALLYDPTMTAAGEYRVNAEIFLFPGDSDAGYGVIFGGEELGDTAGRSYFELLLRRDGSFMIAHRAGTDIHELTPWSKDSAVVAHDGGEEPVLNTIEIDVHKSGVRFMVNEEEVGRLPRSGAMGLDGQVGLRLGSDLNLHVRSLSVEDGPKSDG